ncbi:unnamed protein product [Urochloa humidicola]
MAEGRDLLSPGSWWPRVWHPLPPRRGLLFPGGTASSSPTNGGGGRNILLSPGGSVASSPPVDGGGCGHNLLSPGGTKHPLYLMG